MRKGEKEGQAERTTMYGLGSDCLKASAGKCSLRRQCSWARSWLDAIWLQNMAQKVESMTTMQLPANVVVANAMIVHLFRGGNGD